MFDAENDVYVETFYPFKTGNCNDTKPILINKFSEGKFNKNLNFYPNKMKSLFNCPIRTLVWPSTPVFINKKSQNGTISHWGRDFSVIKALSESLNFKIDFSFGGEEKNVSLDKSYEKFFAKLTNNESDLSFSNYFLTEKRVKDFGVSVLYLVNEIIGIIPPGMEWNALEMLIYPFQLNFWCCVICCGLCGLLVIFVASKKSKIVQDFVFGRNVRNPSLNMFIGFIGGSQTILPARNFARFLLMLFLMYSLVIRTIYQGSYFNSLQSEDRHTHKGVQSVDEMLKQNFTFYSSYGILESLKDIEWLKNR
jgi:hypothetical protein